jgi:peroxiredoxin
MMDLENEPLPEGSRPILSPGASAPEIQIQLSNGFQTKLSDLTKKGTVLVNFIKGTWCPFCQAHMSTLRKWQRDLFATKKVTLLVVSNEPVQVIRDWIKQNPVDFLFGSVQDPKVFEGYGVDVAKLEFPRPAVFLVENGMRIRMSYDGTRGGKLQTLVEKSI